LIRENALGEPERVYLRDYTIFDSYSSSLKNKLSLVFGVCVAKANSVPGRQIYKKRQCGLPTFLIYFPQRKMSCHRWWLVSVPPPINISGQNFSHSQLMNLLDGLLHCETNQLPFITPQTSGSEQMMKAN